jgi:hypothetical protein
MLHGMSLHSLGFLYYRRFKSLVQIILLKCRLSELSGLSQHLSPLLDILDAVGRNEALDGLVAVLDSV